MKSKLPLLFWHNSAVLLDVPQHVAASVVELVNSLKSISFEVFSIRKQPKFAGSHVLQIRCMGKLLDAVALEKALWNIRGVAWHIVMQNTREFKKIRPFSPHWINQILENWYVVRAIEGLVVRTKWLYTMTSASKNTMAISLSALFNARAFIGAGSSCRWHTELCCLVWGSLKYYHVSSPVTIRLRQFSSSWNLRSWNSWQDATRLFLI